jgi:hypothetical protein
MGPYGQYQNEKSIISEEKGRARLLLGTNCRLKGEHHMKPLRSCLTNPVLILFSSVLFGGCYTQFILEDSGTSEGTDVQSVSVDQPPPLPAPPYPGPWWDPSPMYPPDPAGTGPMTTPGKTTAPPKGDTGNQRVPPVPTAPVSPPRGTADSPPPPSAPPAPIVTVPAPAPASPAHSAESRPAGGSGGRR